MKNIFKQLVGIASGLAVYNIARLIIRWLLKSYSRDLIACLVAPILEEVLKKYITYRYIGIVYFAIIESICYFLNGRVDLSGLGLRLIVTVPMHIITGVISKRVRYGIVISTIIHMTFNYVVINLL